MVLAEFAAFLLGDEVGGNGLGAHFFEVDAAAVVVDFDDDAVAALFGGKDECGGAGLALGDAVVWGFDAVVHAVAEHVHERVGEQFDHAVVDADAFGTGVKTDELFLLLREVAHHAGEAAEEGFEGDDAQAQRGFVDEGDEPVGLGLEGGEVVLLADKPVDFWQQLGRVQDAVVGHFP